MKTVNSNRENGQDSSKTDRNYKWIQSVEISKPDPECKIKTNDDPIGDSPSTSDDLSRNF